MNDHDLLTEEEFSGRLNAFAEAVLALRSCDPSEAIAAMKRAEYLRQDLENHDRLLRLRLNEQTRHNVFDSIRKVSEG